MADVHPAWTYSSEPRIEQFGPVRVIGLSCKGKNENGEFSALWEKFIPRHCEITTPKDMHLFLGICRCIPGRTDGSFEYIAALSAAEDASVPEGMMVLQIPKCSYVVFPVRNLKEIMQAWQGTRGWLEAHPEWKTYCGPNQPCDCAHYPCFELYPPEFNGTNGLFIYIPVHK
jgi:predicted transcriptional regulator YdeE